MNGQRVHIVGICGVATSAIAIALDKAGCTVTGSDRGFFPPVSTELSHYPSIHFYAGWHPHKMIEEGVPDYVIAGGSGTSPSNPEITYAHDHNIPVLSLAEALGKFAVRKNSIVVTGTWGKTTSSALLSSIFIHAGLNPSYFTGGISISGSPAAHIGKSDWSIMEGDEYQAAIWDTKPKFTYYSPTHLLLTAVSWDHADLYTTENDYIDTFGKLVGSIPASGTIIAHTNNEGITRIIKGISARVVSYGSHDTDYTFDRVEQSHQGINFTIHHKKDTWDIRSPMIGDYQAENITGCFALAREVGNIEPHKIIEAISLFRGLKRRLEIRLDGNHSPRDITVIDDIAHSPEKASSTLKTLRNIYPGKIIAVFEPNSGGRQPKIISTYNHAFEKADTVVIPHLTRLKLRESSPHTTLDYPLEGGDLSRIIAVTHPDSHYIENDSELVDFVISQAKKGDVVAFLGSHGFRGMIEETVARLKS